MKNKSLSLNYIFNLLKTVMSVIFPLITFPYVSRVLGPQYLGKIDYAQANISYLALISSFGISGYAIREGARIRDDKKKLENFISEMLAINIVTVSVSYILLFLVLLIPKFQPYRLLMLIFSTSIGLSVIGVEWLYNIFEDYQYITIRSFLFQIISIVLMFVFVRDYTDYIKYALILILSSVGSNIFNFIRAGKYVKIKVNFCKNIIRHLKPMCLIFILDLAASVYLIMDRSMLGYITGDDSEVGLYAAVIKITTVVKSLFVSLRGIMTPRVAYLMKHDKEAAERMNYFTAKVIIMLGVPSSVGMGILSHKILILFAGTAYENATITLQILLAQMLIAGFNGFLVNQLFMVNRKEKWGSTAVVLGAVTNLIMNLITIPRFGKNGAAISTVLSELMIFVFCIVVGKGLFDIRRVLKQLISSIFACIPMILIYIVLKQVFSDFVLIIFTIILGAISYFGVLLFIKNELVIQGIKMLKSKIMKNKSIVRRK